VEFIRLVGISVFLQGNVIDLGGYRLQVVEACSGLRYLFPLLTLGVIVAGLIKFKFWMRALLVLTAVPITVLMNSFRIGVVGVLVDRFGTSQAEGFLHYFEGWVIFMACLALMLLEAWALLRLTGDIRPFREVLAFDIPASRAASTPVQRRTLDTVSIFALVFTIIAAIALQLIPHRAEIIPARAEFFNYPMNFGNWSGRRGVLDSQTLDVLKVDDYIMADYLSPDNTAINMYVAYYASQRTGQSAHSPASCLPGGGWKLSEFSDHVVLNANFGQGPLRVNRVIIEQGRERQLVYYWFQQRGRNITNEYLVKWYLLNDALVLNRSDGALVRLITPISPAEETAAADARLSAFAQKAVPQLAQYVPD
jgi:exosortase D (VPLPA-CTERM-specific)